MRKLSTILYSLTIFGLTLSVYSIYTLSLTPYSQIIKLQNDTSIFISEKYAPFTLKYLTDTIRICELSQQPVFSQVPSMLTNFTVQLDFDPFTHFKQHISDFQAYQKLKFKSLTCQCERGECYDFEYLKFHVYQKQSFFDVQQTIAEKTFTIALNRKREGDLQPIELTTSMQDFASSYIQVVNQPNENFRMRCQLEIAVQQLQFDLQKDQSCRQFTQNAFSGIIYPPAWVQAQNQISTSVLTELESKDILQYKRDGKNQLMIIVGMTFFSFVVSAIQYLRNSQNDIDLDDM
ncbi:Transmembrane domain-containing protein [Spironucleus salmonicida]|uniref:Transmembrane domain-containing protein n=1 Tax=Spironucleus salmonicida TaxID=348837 RepID=V6LKQ0_9EUKA|nr:Transmembrane domain-containing protein [Spironucleus salmonicida]|eukprot:EST44938.1 Transmembrane domain-containing protein [Spironucleus salmonicida]